MRRWNKDAWSIHPRDLPSARVLAAEPLLSDLQNNPVFRMMVFHIHRGSAFKNIALSSAATIGMLILINRGSFASGPLFYVLFVGLFLLQWRARGSWRDRLEKETLIPWSRIGDLNAAGLNPNDWMLAYWGSRLIGRRHLALSVQSVIVALLVIGVTWPSAYSSASWPAGRAGAMIFLGLVSFVSSASVSARRYSPHHILGDCAWRLNRVCSRFGGKGYTYNRIFLRSWLSIPVAAVLMLAFPVSAYLAKTVSQFTLIPATMVIACIMGWLVGDLRASYLRRNRHRYLEIMLHDFQLALDNQRELSEAEDQKTPRG